jgi:hypothetical protein
LDEGLLRDYCEYRGLRLEDIPDSLISTILGGIVSAIESYTGRVIGERRFTDHFPPGGPRFILKHYPVQSILKVTVGGVEVTDYTLNDYYGYVVLPASDKEVVVEYIAGDEENKSLYESLILESFYERIYEYRHGMYKGLKAVREGDVQLTYYSGVGWLPLHVQERLEGLKRPMVGVLQG